MSVTRHAITSGAINLYAESRGNPQNPALILVHGYPDNHSVWDQVAAQLADEFFVIAYDVRGAGQSDKPARVADYRMPLLAQDLKAVADAIIPGQRFHLAAHDWGSIQSWESVTTELLKGRIISFSSVSGPCLDHMGFWMRSHLFSLSPLRIFAGIRQLFASWYIVFFQIPVLAPLLWRLVIAAQWNRYLRLREEVSEPDDNPTQANDGVIGVRLYRANFIGKMLRPQKRYAHCPVQLIVPTRDNYVGTQLFDELGEWVEHLYRRDLDATHWAPLTHAPLMAQWIRGFAHAVSNNKEDAELRAARVSAPARTPLNGSHLPEGV